MPHTYLIVNKDPVELIRNVSYGALEGKSFKYFQEEIQLARGNMLLTGMLHRVLFDLLDLLSDLLDDGLAL